MKTMGNRLVVIAAITLGGFAACNETVGECWYYGEGTENAGAGPGGGVMIPTGPAGVGGYGEGPPKEPQDATDRPPPDCNEEEDDATELGEVRCGKSTWGADCMIQCAKSGVNCPAGYPHTLTNELGLLIRCCSCPGDQKCVYIYNSGEKCALRPETGVFLCGVE